MKASELTRDERHEIHEARINELIDGSISGKEFVKSLIEQVGFSTDEARSQWHELFTAKTPLIYQVRSGAPVSVETKVGWQQGRITSFYGSDLGAVVELESGYRVPFSLFELRVRK